MSVVVRFAPSPTGFLHIGGARTALFNWLLARRHGGKFYLRIEDTDADRNVADATQAIIDGLKWLGLTWDDCVAVPASQKDGYAVIQSRRLQRHAEVAQELVKKGAAYYCYHTPAELEAMREAQLQRGEQPRIQSQWRERDPRDAPADVPPVIRLKAPLDGETVIDDLVQGTVRVANTQLDDMILLRSNGTPTYMHSVVVDDYDMGITHIIRGDDHLNNAFRQKLLYQAAGWPVPQMAHIPLIHREDGRKMSKRRGAVGLHEFAEMGYLPEAVANYLMRLSWSHGDQEIISIAEALQLFAISDVNKAPPRFDYAKLNHLNAHYMQQAEPTRLISLTSDLLQLSAEQRTMLERALPILRPRAQTLREMVALHPYLFSDEITPDADAARLLTEQQALLQRLHQTLSTLQPWDRPTLEAAVKAIAQDLGQKLGAVASPLRAALTGRTNAPSNFDIMVVLGQPLTLARLAQAMATA